MKKRKSIGMLFTMCIVLFMLTACSSSTKTSDSKEKSVSTVSEAVEPEEITSNQVSEDTTPTTNQLQLEGKTLFVYCGAGMTKPFTEIVDAFQDETGAKVEVSFANAAQIISQITASNEGDLFIAGAEGELDPIKEEYVTGTKSLVKHIPVIAVQTGNPKGITALSDFANEDVTVILGDEEATPIGKIANKALTDAGILDSVNIIARTSTAPEISTSISLDQCDAAIVWKENANVEGVEIVETTDMDNYIKTVPAASLKCSTNEEAREAFLEYLDSDTVKDIWESYGYELAN